MGAGFLVTIHKPRNNEASHELSRHRLKSSTLKTGPLVYLWFPLQSICFPCSPPSLMTPWLCLPHILLLFLSLFQCFVITHVCFHAHWSPQDSPRHDNELPAGPSTPAPITSLRDDSGYLLPCGQQALWEALGGTEGGGSDVS